MRLAGIRKGDIVLVDACGQRCHAFVISEAFDAIENRVIEVAPLNGRHLPACVLTARQVIGHWRKAKA